MEEAFAAWVQAFTGLIALILSVISFFQSKSIKELVGMVDELKSHTTIMRDELSLQREIYLYQKAAIFRINRFDNKTLTLSLHNMGQTAFKAKLRNISPAYLEVKSEKVKVEKNASLELSFNLVNVPISRWISDKMAFSCDIVFETVEGLQLQQSIKNDATRGSGFFITTKVILEKEDATS
ncbi:MAG: hypothetical protein JWQ96_678 [Segetibacter sp.]|nr:hypothetical protein [Segetibacter sp.]